MKLEVVIPKELEGFVQTLAALPKFMDANGVVVEALYWFREEYEAFLAKQARLRAEIQKGIDELDRGESVDGPTFMAELLEQYRAQTRKTVVSSTDKSLL